MARNLAFLVLGVLLAFALVRVAMPRGATEPLARVHRRRAEWTTVAAAVVTGYLVAVCVVAANPGGVPNPAGALAFIALVVALVADLLVLRAAWRPVVRDRRAAADALREAVGGAEPPTAERRHRGLSGEETPPTRW